MIKTHLKLFFILLLLSSGCKEDSDISSPHFSNELLGKWELISGDSENWKYLIFTSENYFYMLIRFDYERHEIYDGVYSITGSQINMRGTLYNFDIKNDTLTLFSPSDRILFVRNNSAPGKDEWVIPINIIKEIPLNGVNIISDITFDGKNFWVSDYDVVIKIDTMGRIAAQYPVNNPSGITFGDGFLWVSSFDTLNKINIQNGEIISKKEIQTETGQIYKLAGYDNGYLWASDYSRIMKIDANLGIVFYFFPFFDTHGLELHNGKIWCSYNHDLYDIDSSDGKVINTYRVSNRFFIIKGITFADGYFWAIAYYYQTNSYYLLKLDLPG